MGRRKFAKPSPSHKSPGRGKGGNHNNRNNNSPQYFHNSNDPDFWEDDTPTGFRRGKRQRQILLGGDFKVNQYGRNRSGLGSHGFTMAQEAQNTEDYSYSSRRNDDKKLRNLRITFVRPENPDDPSAQIGTIQPILNKQPPKSNTSESEEEVAIETVAEVEATIRSLDISEDVAPKISIQDQAPSIPAPKPPKSPQSSSNDEEEVVFVPRNQRRNPTSETESLAPPSSNNTIKPEISESSVHKAPVPEAPPAPVISSSKTVRTVKYTKKAQRFRGKAKQRQYVEEFDDDDDDGILQDYLQNIRDNGDDNDDIFSMRPLGGELDEIDLSGGQSTSADRIPFSMGDDSEDGLDSSDSDSDDVKIEIEVEFERSAVIDRRTGQSGLEYLFKPAGSNATDAMWLGGTDMLRDIQHLIDIFEANLEDGGDSETLPSDEEMDADASILQDENLARLLQAQENGYEIEAMDDDQDDEDFDSEFLMDMIMGKPNKTGKFPSASKLADAYDDFDVMDRSRASLAGKSNRKSRRAIANQSIAQDFDMDDDDRELEVEMMKMVALQEQDRARKRVRKQEREQLRQAGLLGKSPGKPGSMDVRGFQGDLTAVSVNDLLKQFLMSGKAERLSLMPMSKEERKDVHLLVHKFGITSKSQGKGDKRFPVLNKTKRTRLFEGNEEEIDWIIANHGRSFRTGATRSARTKPTKVHHKDGMVVGAGVAEIGQGNKGYEMLAKMGWTTGTGLGSSRSGIIDPVQAIVKNSRTGLG